MQAGNKLLRASVFIIPIAISLVFLNCHRQSGISLEKYNQIQKGFQTLQDTNKVWCYYYWIGDDISIEGITKDMESMKEFGIGAVLIGNINPDEADGPVPLFSDEWWDIIVHAVNEGHRLGIDIGFFNCPGWSQSGGPWVGYDKAMRHLVYSEAKVQGPVKIHLNLKKPREEFQDTYVLAFKSLESENKRLKADNLMLRTTPVMPDPGKWFDNDTSTSALFSLTDNATYTVDISSKEKIHARSLILHPARPQFLCNVELYALLDGDYKMIKSFIFDRSNTDVNVGPVTHGPLALAIPETNSGDFRLVCSNFVSNEKQAGFSEIIITEEQIFEKYIEKSLGKMHPTPLPLFDSYLWQRQEEVTDKSLLISEVLDISTQMDKNGTLTWEAPEGNWTILRVGMTPTGTKNSPSAPQGKGYEVDKANSELVRFHFDQFIGEILKRIPEGSRSAFKYVIADSYEMGSQNWTDGFGDKFKSRYGYDPVRYLPVFSGRIVGSVEESERFLWDLRRAIADDIAYEYVGGLRKASNEKGLKTWLENYGHWGYPGEFLMYGGQSDLVSGEFWNEGTLGDIECKSASSAAHMYGKTITSAESFTAGRQSYKRHPALLKKRGDWSFTEGINHVVLHVVIQQPDDKRIPGINAWFSTEFNRHNTWFKEGKSWVDYLRRCQNMLQQGKYVADVCYFIGEDAPKMTGTRNPELPNGYSYDYINAEVIMTRLAVKDGRFVLPDGMSYALLILPELKSMRPQVLAKIEELVKQGGAVLGSKPSQSPSLQDYPACDSVVKDITTRLWAGEYKDGKLVHRYGKGYQMDGLSVQEALDLLKVTKDIDLGDDVPVLWTHRSLPGMDIYFLTNNSEEEVNLDASFRVTGLKPQLWDAVTGEIRPLNQFTSSDKRKVVPINLKPLQSWFVVFTNKSNENTLPGYVENFPVPETFLTIEGDWTLDFQNKIIGPQEPEVIRSLSDWTNSENEKIRYYSGTARYKIICNIDQVPETGSIILDLGEVGVMAHAWFNEDDLGGTWIKPFTLPVNNSLKQGKNILEIEVVNTWRNYLIKEDNLPVGKRYTWTSVEDIDPGEKLTPSGLMGPVTLRLID